MDDGDVRGAEFHRFARDGDGSADGGNKRRGTEQLSVVTACAAVAAR